ncbi:MAG: 30S ribosomal protein S4 [Verrucomicrobiota bacterium]|jgi:small subunit ribosomal protein S4|nr:30S ribosomal protein S4 [Verrucomicrobiota bacterium]MEE2813528.1 30S ribosomal protein S4 [Verrucomicrobiota bacterium]
MARYTGPRVRLSRRFNTPLFGASKYLERKPYPPGVHGQNRRRKATDYALALAEKQKMRFYYGLMEKQFRGVYEKAIRRRGVTGEIMLQILETRLDSVVYNLGFGYTRSQARQMVSHGHVMVNSKRARTPSIALHEGDVVEIKTVEKSRHLADKNLEYSTSRVVPEWLTLDKAAYKGTVTRLPTREDIEPIANEQTIVEFYSR